jgi:carbamoyltransferase
LIVLGINSYHANSSAALVVDGELVFAIEEERLNRIKNSAGFPKLAIEECLKYKKINLNDIDLISINSNPKTQLLKKIKFSLENLINFSDIVKKLHGVSKKINLREEINKIKNFGTFKGKIINTEHHLSHIASSYFISEFDEAAGISVDGSGDFTTTSNSLCKDQSISMHDRIFYPHSLGVFYSSITNFLGYENYGEEYKVMALGASGDSSLDSKLEKIIDLDNDGKFKLNLDYFIHQKKIKTFSIKNNNIILNELLNVNRLEELLGIKKRNRKESLNQEHLNLARSLQNIFERAYIGYINYTYNKFQITNLCLAGGCAMNSLANGKILKETNFKRIYIQPAAYDAGGAIGAALNTAAKHGDIIVRNKRTKLYLGPQFSHDEIKVYIENKKNIFNKKNIKVKNFLNNDKELIDNITELLIKKKILGIFRGRLEWGARALGNRSIIADPRGKDVKDIINHKIKRRESFRPFAPMILLENLKEWFDLDREVASMMEVHKIKKEKKYIIPAVVHHDESCRLQTVNKEDNKFIHDLLSNFNNKTGVPILLNTSFNENEPIVCNPIEAIDTFVRTEMDALILENYILLRS